MHMTFDRKTPKAEISLRLALAKSTRNHPKRHATGGRRKKLSIAKKRRAAHKKGVNARKYARYLDASRAYWSGAADELRV